MISIDTIYQRVLAAANKEQRGYITPQEFNLFANQAQMDIFEQYFYDLNQFDRLSDNNTEFSNMTTLIDEKISVFKQVKTLTSISGSNFEMPSSLTGNDDFYRLGTVMYNSKHIVEEIEHKDLLRIQLSKLSEPTMTQPVYIRKKATTGQQTIEVFPQNITSGISVTQINKPNKVNWGYVVIDGKALYNATTSVNFELHASEEKELVLKILQLSGIMLKDSGLYASSSQEEDRDISQEKK
tara:strand:- start:7736 stop:8455 length:720 start_codon:yes stop_codon:yes gene_type:complete